MLLDLQARPMLPPDRQVLSEIDWSEVGTLWNTNELGVLHDLLNERWSRLIRNSVLGTRDPEAEFLQGLAFATLALFFTQNRNQEGALLMVDDALIALGKYRPHFMGVQIDPIIGTLQTLRPLIASLPADGENPMFPFVYAKFEHDGALPT
ncbi:DUF309 domain-containing protein [Thauera aromatica]|nr:DUF309 domain-containing protein [Thauera aromatica]MCK2125931.1 DUF309 domain-containing protein [Thauera aromatica]